jgi:hypothetical protein
LKKEFLTGKKYDFIKIGQNYIRIEKPVNKWNGEKPVEPEIKY